MNQREEPRISLRRFTDDDAAVLQRKQYPEIPLREIRAMMAEWETQTYRGRYFAIFAITADGAVVGSVSLYEQAAGAASIGVEVYPDERRKGYAAEGMLRMTELAGQRGFRVIRDQVRADNQASRALHRKLGFETDGQVRKNAKGKEVLPYTLRL